jgi:hypothetical protein
VIAGADSARCCEPTQPNPRKPNHSSLYAIKYAQSTAASCNQWQVSKTKQNKDKGHCIVEQAAAATPFAGA